jgi:hypothetical protein
LLSLLEIGVWIFACMLLRTRGSSTTIFYEGKFLWACLWWMMMGREVLYAD